MFQPLWDFKKTIQIITPSLLNTKLDKEEIITEMLNTPLYLCPLVVVTGHGMDITDQSLEGREVTFYTSIHVF